MQISLIAPARQRHQHDDPHGLLVTEPAVVDRRRRAAPIPAMIRVIASSSMTSTSGALPRLAGQLTAPVEDGVLGAQPQPARFGQAAAAASLLSGMNR